MTIVRVFFYTYWKKPINALIAVWTWLPNIGTPPVSHIELGFYIDQSDIDYMKKEWFQYQGDLPDSVGWWEFSSTMRDNAKGCRWIKQEEMIKHKERWLVIELKYWSRPKRIMLDACCKVLNAGYDKLGILGFVMPFGFNDKDKWYCSEICWKVLTGEAKLLISPRRCYQKIMKLGGNKIEV